MKHKKTTLGYSSLRAYARYIMTFKGRFFATFGTFMVSNVLLALLPVFIGQFIETATQADTSKDLIFFLVGVLIAISVFHDMTWRIAEVLYRNLLTSKLYEFETLVFRAVISKPYPYFIDKFTGKISSYVTGLAREFREFVGEVCYEYSGLIVNIPIASAIMFSVNWQTGVVFVSGLLVMFMAGRALVRRTVMAERALTDVSSSLDGYVIDTIANFVSVKAFRREQAELISIQTKRRDVVKKALRMQLWSIFFWGAMSLIVRWVIWPGTILMNVYFFLEGQISLAQLSTFISALLVFSNFIWEIIWSVSQFNLKLGRIEESYRYLFGKHNVVKEMLSRPDAMRSSSPGFTSSLTLEDLNFAYPDKPEHTVLKDISLHLSKNEKVGIVGASGSGKTTLIKLLLGYYELPKGMMKLDGKPIANDQLVDLIAYVPQDTALFHRTIKENIAYGTDSEVSQEKIEEAARRARAHEFIMAINGGYEALVGERGIKLSMGQRQRIAIARAFLDEKPLLILDEATSALDSESEVLVQQALEDLWHDRTVIAIAHRLSTLRNMDRIVVLDQGKLIEQGTHDELLAKRGRYYRLWQHQSGGVLLDEATD